MSKVDNDRVREIAHLLVGGVSDRIYLSLQEELNSAVAEMLAIPIVEHSRASHTLAYGSKGNDPKLIANQAVDVTEFMECAKYLSTTEHWMCVDDTERLSFFKSATCMRKGGAASVHNVVRRGNVLQTLICFHPEDFLLDQIQEKEESSHYSMGLFAVKVIFAKSSNATASSTTHSTPNDKQSAVFAIVRRCHVVEENYLSVDSEYKELVFILKLTEYVRRVEIMNVCFTNKGTGTCDKHSECRMNGMRDVLESAFTAQNEYCIDHNSMCVSDQGGMYHFFY